MWWITLFLHLGSSYAQLTPPSAVVCVGEELVFVCQQSLDLIRWRVRLPGMMPLTAQTPAEVGRVDTFPNDPGFGFQITTTSTASTNITSELNVTAAEELDGVAVECEGFSKTFMSIIQVTVVDPPAAPSGVVTTIDESQFTPNTASITLTWSASSGADNYTIMVTPPLPSGQSLLSTTATRLQLTVLYNIEYSIDITVQNCAGNNSTTVPIMVGCSPSTLLTIANGRISEHSSGAVGAMLKFQCDDGYMPREALSSTCLSNNSWSPVPECKVSQCAPPAAPVNGYITSNYSSAVEGSQITFHCGGDSPVMTSTCSNGNWIPDPADLDCGSLPQDPGVYAGIATTILLLVIMLTTTSVIVIVGIKKKRGYRTKLSYSLDPAGVRSKPLSFKLDSYEDSNQNGTDYAQTWHPGPRIKNQTHPVVGEGDTLVYADLGPSSTNCSAHSNVQDDHRVMYSTLNLALQQPLKKPTHNKSSPCPSPADKSLDLDSLLIQLKPQVIDKWEQFAEAVGLSNLIQQLSKYSPDECIVEVFDQWLKSHPTKPTWRNVADVLNDIGLHQLAKDILKVYETGKLPIIVDMDAVPENLTSDNGTPPPLPPKLEDSSSDYKIESVQHEERSAAVPPRPPKPPVRPPKPVL